VSVIGITDGPHAPLPRSILHREHRRTQRLAGHVHDVLGQGGTLVGHAEGLLVFLCSTLGRAVAMLAVGIRADVPLPIPGPGPQLRGTGVVVAAGDGAKGTADPARLVASGDRPSSAWLTPEPFRDSQLAATLVRVALAIEKREREAKFEAKGAGLPGARGSGGANERDRSLNVPAKLGATSDDVPMRPVGHSVEEAS
jgi:hypothetical protein